MIHHTPNQQLCDDDKLIAVLRDGEDAEEHKDVVEHIEQCSRCQQRFDELAASAQDWTKARQALLNDDPGSENRVGSAKWDYSLRNDGPVAWTESMASQLLSPASHPELLGRIGRYDVERLIGSGGMGIVFKAHDSELNRPVAIKILAPYLSSSGPARKRFAREARAAAAVVHEHVVPIYNVETERETPFLVMHYIAGESLQGRIDREGALELCEILRIGMQVASGLSAAHQQGLVHRDIKPSNILMEQGVERALITDFGLARAANDASLTRTGFHPGTPQYMSPEQAAGEQVDARSDLFSLGSVLYTMCTGRPPFRAETSLGVLRRITDVEPRPIREINPNIPEWLCLLIARLMSKSPADRFASALEVSDLLGQCLAHVQQPTSAPLPASLVPHAANIRRSLFKTTRKGVIAMFGAIGMALLGMMMLWQATEPPDISGQWNSDEWGTVVLESKEKGVYHGTFTGAEAKQFSVVRDAQSENQSVFALGEGKVIDVRVENGQAVKKGEILLVLLSDSPLQQQEIEILQICSKIDGVVATSQVKQNLLDRLVRRGDLLLEIRPLASGAQFQGEFQHLSGFAFNGVATTSVTLQVKWSRIERRFNGTWKAGESSNGKLSLRLVDDEIRGAWTTAKDAQKESGGPRLADLLWKRSGVTSTASIAGAEKEFHQLELAEEDLRAAYGNAIENAKSDEDRERAEKQFDARDAYTPKYLAFEEKYRGTPAGLKALINVVGFARSTIDPNSPAPAGRVKAVDRLIDHYVAFDGIEQAFDDLRGGLPVPREKELLKAVFEKNPSRHVQAESLIAQLELIRVTLSRYSSLPALRERALHPDEHHPEFWQENKKAVLRELESTNPDQLRAEMKAIIERLEEFSLVPVAKYGMAYKAARHLSHSINKVVIGKPAPEIKAITSVGKQFQLSKLRGSTVLLVFGLNHSSDNDVMYAPLRKLADDYKSRHVEVVMILESDEDRFQSASALKRHFPWTVIQEPSAGSLSLDWGVRGYPTVFFIDAKGILQSWTVGLPCYDDDSGYDATEVAAELDRLLNGKPKDTEQTFQPPAASDVNDKRLGLSPESEEHPMESSAGHKSCPFCEIESKTIRQEIQASETWSGELPGSEELNAYIAAIRALPDSSTERFKFYWNHLEHANETIAEDSSKEVAFAMHEYWNTGERPFDFKLFADLNQVRLWLKDAHVPEHRRRVYLRLLGIVGSDEDTEVLKRTISNRVRENPNSNLQAQIEACVLLGGPAAWDFVEQEILLTPGVPDTNVYAMILAVRFFDTHSKLISRDRLLQSLHLMLDNTSLSDLAVKELIRMEDWSQVEKLVGLLKSSDENSKWVRHPIVQYLQACPLPEAANELAKLKEISKAVERVLQQPRKTSNTSEAVKDSAVTVPPIEFDTLEDLMRPAKELFDNEMKQIDERLATVVEGSAENSLLTTKKNQLQQRWDLSVAQVKGILAAAKAGKPVQLDRIEIPNHSSRPGKAPTPVPLSGHDEDIAKVLAGTWQLKRYVQDAEEASFEGSVTFSKSMMIVHLKQGDKQEELQQMYRIGSEKIDLWDMDDGPDIRTSLPHLGSYSIENDTLRICYHESPMEDDVPQARPPVRPCKKFIFLELQRNVVAEKVNVAKGKTNYADLQGDWIVDSFYVDKDANSRELQKLGSTALLLRTIRVEANELYFRNPPVAGMSRISGAISIKPAEGGDAQLFQVVDSREPGEDMRFGMYKVVGDKLTILLTRDAPPKLLAPTEGEFYIECHRAVSEEDKELLDVINKNPDQINVIDLILKDSEKSVSAKEDATATGSVSGTEKPSATRAPDANGIYWSSRDLDHWVSGMKVLHWPNAVNRNLIVEFVLRNDSPETREVDVHLYCGDKTSLLLGEGNNVSVDIKETRREKQTAVPNGVLTFKEGRAEISFEGLETGEYTLRFQRVMDLQLDDDRLPRGVSRHGVPSDVSLPVKFDSSQDNLPIYWGKPVAGLRIGAMFLDSRKDHMRSFKPRDQAASQLFVQNVGSKEVECGFDPPYHSGGWGVEIADKVGQRISGVWKDEPRSVGVLIPPPPMWARLDPNEIQPFSGEFTKFRVRDDDYGGTTHYEHAKFTIVAEKPEELRALPPHDYLMPTGEYNALFSATLRKAESPAATFALESGPCPFRVGEDGTTSTQDEEDVQWGPAGQNGLQAGVRFNPSQTTYVVGQPIKLEFFFRTVNGRSLEGSLPNVFDFDGVEACDTTGETLPALHASSEVVGGWMSVHFSDKPMFRTYEKLTIVAETDGKLKNAESLASAISSDSSVVRAHPGTDCHVRFTVPNFANGADGTLQTGEVAFRVNEALKGSNPTN